MNSSWVLSLGKLEEIAKVVIDHHLLERCVLFLCNFLFLNLGRRNFYHRHFADLLELGPLKRLLVHIFSFLLVGLFFCYFLLIHGILLQLILDALFGHLESLKFHRARDSLVLLELGLTAIDKILNLRQHCQYVGLRQLFELWIFSKILTLSLLVREAFAENI